MGRDQQQLKATLNGTVNIVLQLTQRRNYFESNCDFWVDNKCHFY